MAWYLWCLRWLLGGCPSRIDLILELPNYPLKSRATSRYPPSLAAKGYPGIRYNKYLDYLVLLDNHYEFILMAIQAPSWICIVRVYLTIHCRGRSDESSSLDSAPARIRVPMKTTPHELNTFVKSDACPRGRLHNWGGSNKFV